MPAEHVTAAAALSVTGGVLTIFGVSTGIYPGLLLAGWAGGLWAQSGPEVNIPLAQRMVVSTISALIASIIAQPVAHIVVAAGIVPGITLEVAGAPVAVLVGLLAINKLGPMINRGADVVADVVESRVKGGQS